MRKQAKIDDVLDTLGNSTKFIRKYKLAIKLKWTLEGFATYVGMQPDSVRRKLGKIAASVGTTLPLLKRGDSELTASQISDFEREYNKSLSKAVGTTRTGKKYVVTSAQNATPIHIGFYNSLMTYCKHNNAELIVMPFTYRNPTSLWNNGSTDDWYAPLLSDHLVDVDLQVCSNLFIMGTINTSPTSSDPIVGFESFTGSNSTIIGNPKIQSKSVPTLGKPKLLLSTGAITLPNYSRSKAGAKAAFHHSIAALVVEIEDDNATFHVRHIHGADSTGNFYDLDKFYTASGVTGGHRALALVTGDTHAEFIDETVENVTYHNADSIVAMLRPRTLVFHDLCDFYTRNHHHRGNEIIAIGKQRYGRNNVEEGLQAAADFVDRVSRDDCLNVIVRSNHDEAFDRWLREAESRNDAENAQFYHYMKYHQFKNIKKTNTGFETVDAFEFWCKFPENGLGLDNLANTKFLQRDESFLISSIEVGCHGDVGSNGARGDIKSLARLSHKMIIGHSHSPGIYEGCYQVGLSAMKNLEYRKGPSSWMHTHCVIYPDGKRTLINIINGTWKA